MKQGSRRREGGSKKVNKKLTNVNAFVTNELVIEMEGNVNASILKSNELVTEKEVNAYGTDESITSKISDI